MKSNNKPTVNARMTLAMRLVLRVLLIFVFLGLLLFLPAGSFQYWEAWLYCLTLLIPAFFVITYFYKKDPEFIERRILKRREKEKEHRSIQERFSGILLLGLLIPGFDYRFHWSNVPAYLVIISDLIVLSGYLIMVRVMRENRFASAIIEKGKEQKVIETGLYKIVRHPMYTGGILFLLFTPIALGSYWALIPFLIVVPTALVLRIIGEEKFLNTNLPEYSEYCRKTKYRLIPFIW